MSMQARVFRNLLKFTTKTGLQIELLFRKSVCVDWIGVQFSHLIKKHIRRWPHLWLFPYDLPWLVKLVQSHPIQFRKRSLTPLNFHSRPTNQNGQGPGEKKVWSKIQKSAIFELHKCYTPQKKAENNRFSKLKSNIWLFYWKWGKKYFLDFRCQNKIWESFYHFHSTFAKI